VAEAARGSGGRLIGYTLVNPKDEQAPALVEKALGTLGLRGLLTFPAMHHFKAARPACSRSSSSRASTARRSSSTAACCA
jgi:predicted TIM-barrel fold metal-dependent hydrolase